MMCRTPSNVYLSLHIPRVYGFYCSFRAECGDKSECDVTQGRRQGLGHLPVEQFVLRKKWESN